MNLASFIYTSRYRTPGAEVTLPFSASLFNPPTRDPNAKIAVSVDGQVSQRTVVSVATSVKLTYFFPLSELESHDDFSDSVLLGNDVFRIDATQFSAVNKVLLCIARPVSINTTRRGCKHLERSLEARVIG